MLTRCACAFYRQFVFVLTEWVVPFAFESNRDVAKTRTKNHFHTRSAVSTNQSIIQSIKRKKCVWMASSLFFCFSMLLFLSSNHIIDAIWNQEEFQNELETAVNFSLLKTFQQCSLHQNIYNMLLSIQFFTVKLIEIAFFFVGEHFSLQIVHLYRNI